MIRRIGQALIVVVGVTLLVFLLERLIPGGYARASIGPRATPEEIYQFKKINGLFLPLWDQFYQYIRGLVESFNLGYSYQFNQSVTAVIGERLPKTLVLVGISTAFALIVAIPLGVLQVVRRNKPVDYSLTGLSFIFYSMPPFLLGQLLILYFAIDMHWFSTEAPQGQSVGAILGDPRGLVLPIITLAAITVAQFSRYMRSSMMEAMTQDYIRTARAKGAGPWRVLFRHALRNALIPIITLVGLSLPAIFAGALITETVFNFPGMGLLTTNSALNDDVPVLLGTTFVVTLATVAGSLIADIAYAIVDPRVRYT